VLVDRKLMEKKQQQAKAKINQIKDKINKITGGIQTGENANTKVFKEYLFKQLHLPVLKMTEKGSEALDDEVLILLRGYCEKHYPALTELFHLILEFRKWSKIKSTFIDGYLKYINTKTSRIHCDFYPLATKTGRFVCKNPNLQQCPRKGSDPIGVRNFIKASKGNVLLSLDFSQIELRVGAFYCKDEKMVNTYKQGGDIHAQTTAIIYHISIEEAMDKTNPKYKERRAIAKNCNFGTFYGLYPKGLKRTLNIKAGLDTNLNECEMIIKNLKLGYNRLTKWQENAINEARQKKYTETFLGRRRYLPYIDSDDFKRRSFAKRCALNTPIQGTAADILKLAINRILNGLNERDYIKPLLIIHDELVFEVPKKKKSEAITFIKSCMEKQPFNEFNIPLIAEVSQGDNFGNLN
ncbi:MAG: bifunctional 3'-5' exonuclease/DNA polymerase, partial [Oscillospiraceae bacterium]|nr:bifunctional 3'-5' exonuclease/DNA polymerase [Oscillospiraceae bacterium]